MQLNTSSNELFDVYYCIKYAKEISENLNKKYILENIGT